MTIAPRWLKIFGLSLAAALVACSPAPSPAPSTGSDPSSAEAATTIRVGYFPNLTHSQALIGLARGDFQDALGPAVRIEPTSFNAGPAVIEALFADAIDLAYIGPNPAINGYVKSNGQALRIVAGATSGGAAFVVRPEAGIQTPADLAGKKLATPQLGGTQDVALRNFIVTHGLMTTENGGTVEIIPTDNSQTLDLFRQGMIDGAWVPEPWASRLIVEGGGTVFVDERDLWPNGDFVTTHIIVSTGFLEDHPDLVKKWLEAHVAITQWEQANPAEARTAVNAEIEKITGKKLKDEVIAQAWERLTVTWDPIASSLTTSAESAFNAGFLSEKPDLTGIYDLTLLNEVLSAKGLSTITP